MMASMGSFKPAPEQPIPIVGHAVLVVIALLQGRFNLCKRSRFLSIHQLSPWSFASLQVVMAIGTRKLCSSYPFCALAMPALDLSFPRRALQDFLLYLELSTRMPTLPSFSAFPLP